MVPASAGSASRSCRALRGTGAGQVVPDRGAGLLQPGLAVGRDAVLLHVADDETPLVGGYPGRGAAQGGGQQVPGEAEERAPHGQLLDEAALVVEGAFDVRDRLLGPGLDREVDGGGVRRVQHGHGAGGGQGVGHPVPGMQGVPAGQARPALPVGHEACWCAHGTSMGEGRPQTHL